MFKSVHKGELLFFKERANLPKKLLSKPKEDVRAIKLQGK